MLASSSAPYARITPAPHKKRAGWMRRWLAPPPAMPVVKSDVDATYAAKFYERTGIIYTGGSGTSTLLSVLR